MPNLVFSFSPSERKETRRKRERSSSWRAPEHSKMTKDMRRVWPVDDLGRRIHGREKELLVDARPTIMRQYQNSLDTI